MSFNYPSAKETEKHHRAMRSAQASQKRELDAHEAELAKEHHQPHWGKGEGNKHGDIK